MPRWLVTGASGFLGGHVFRALQAHECTTSETRIFALGRRLPEGCAPDRFRNVDLMDSEALSAAVARIAPDFVVHLAGRTPPAPAADFFQANTRATVQLLQALSRLDSRPRVIVVGSAAELGPVPANRLPVDESCPCRPEGPYAISKWFASTAALNAPAGLEVIVARIFNLSGPGMPSNQVFGRYAALLAQAGPGRISLNVPNLDARRDFIDVRDAAQALLALALSGNPRKVYHVGTGQSWSIREGLEQLITLSGREVDLVDQGNSPRGLMDSRANINRIQHDTGWQPRIKFEQSLADIWLHARRDALSRRVA